MKKYDYIESEDYFDMALGWSKGGNYEKSVSCLTRAIELNPNFIYAYIALARIYGRLKKYSNAVHALKQAVRIDPGFDRLYFLISKYAYKGGDYKNALIYINKALALDRKMLYELMKERIEG